MPDASLIDGMWQWAPERRSQCLHTGTTNSGCQSSPPTTVRNDHLEKDDDDDDDDHHHEHDGDGIVPRKHLADLAPVDYLLSPAAYPSLGKTAGRTSGATVFISYNKNTSKKETGTAFGK